MLDSSIRDGFFKHLIRIQQLGCPILILLREEIVKRKMQCFGHSQQFLSLRKILIPLPDADRLRAYAKHVRQVFLADAHGLPGCSDLLSDTHIGHPLA